MVAERVMGIGYGNRKNDTLQELSEVFPSARTPFCQALVQLEIAGAFIAVVITELSHTYRLRRECIRSTPVRRWLLSLHFNYPAPVRRVGVPETSTARSTKASS